jgi:hypothetical protein
MDKNTRNPLEVLKGWEYQAYSAFKKLHDLKPIFHLLGKEEIIFEAHSMYDRIFRLSQKKFNTDTPFEKENLTKEETCRDHPLSARLAFRAIMTDWPPFMNDFDDFKVEFKKLIMTIKISKKDNQNVKLHSNGFGDIVVYKLINDRYGDMVFINKDTGVKKVGFPLEIPEWYLEGERKRLSDILILQYKRMKKPELVKRCIEKGLDEKGNKKILTDRLLEHHADPIHNI